MASLGLPCILPCKAINGYRNSSKFCRLPRGLADELGHHSGRIACLRVIWLEELSDVPSIYVAWNGSICSGSGDDLALEIPTSAFYGEDGNLALEALLSIGNSSEDVVFVEVQLVEQVEDAIAIELIPTNYQDWEIVSARSMIVEELLLRQMSMVIFARSFKVQLDGSMEVSFRVSMLETASTRRTLGANGMPDEGIYTDDLIALLNERTVVSVVPLERPNDEGKESEEGLNQKNYELTIEDLKNRCLKYVEKLSATRSLSLLPDSLRSEDTSIKRAPKLEKATFETLRELNSEKHTGEAGKESTLLDECLDLFSSPGRSPSESVISEEEGKETDILAFSDLRESNTTCLVHPSFLSSLIWRALNAVVPYSEANQRIRQDVMKALTSHCHSPGRLVVDVYPYGKNNDDEGFQSVQLRLCTHDGIRPGSVSLPPCILTCNHSESSSKNSTNNSSFFAPLSNCEIVCIKILSKSLMKAHTWPWSEHVEATSLRLYLEAIGSKKQSVLSLRTKENHVVSDLEYDRAHLRSLKSSFRAWLEAEIMLAHGLDPPVVMLCANIVLSLRSMTSSDANACEERYLLKATDDGPFVLKVPQKDKVEDASYLEEALGLSEHLQILSAKATFDSASGSQTNRPFESPLTANHWKLHKFGLPKAPIGLEIPMRGLLQALLPSILPEAVLARLTCSESNSNRGMLRLKKCAEYPRSVVLCGASGSGKSTLIRSLVMTLSNSSRTLCLVRVVLCRELARKAKHAESAKEAFQELSKAFSDALETSERTARPTIILLEDLDELCGSPVAGSDGNGDQGQGSHYNERAALMSLHLEQLLNRVGQQAQACTQKALAVMSVSPNPQQCDHIYRRQEAVLAYFRGAVVVIATCKHQNSLSPRLFNSRQSIFEACDCALFTHTVNIPPMLRAARLTLLKEAAAFEGCPLSLFGDTNSAGIENELLSLQLEEHLMNATEGLTRRDIFCIARRLLLSKVVTTMSRGNNLPLVCSVDEVIAECDSYLGANNQNSESKSQNGVTWSDVGGLWEVKRAIVEVLRAPVLYWKLYHGSPVRSPRGVLLYGPPGCGKTYLAKAVAEYCGLHMISVAGPELLGKYIGSSEKAVRDVFIRAQNLGKPTLIFFDELESLAPKRGTDNTGVTDRVVNQLLTFLDGAERRPGESVRTRDGHNEDDDQDERDVDCSTQRSVVYIMAATSRPDLIDKALLRPGRIEKHLYVGQPSDLEKKDIMLKALQRYPTDDAPSSAAGDGIHEGNMDVRAVVEWICTQEKAQSMVSADFGALVSSAFLAATHEFICGGDGVEEGVRKSVVLCGRHLQSAFRDLRPSISRKDMHFFRKMHASFGQIEDLRNTLENASSDSTGTPRKNSALDSLGHPPSRNRDADGGDVGNVDAGILEAGGFLGLPLGYVPAYGGSPLRAQYSSGQSPSRRQIVRSLYEDTGHDHGGVQTISLDGPGEPAMTHSHAEGDGNDTSVMPAAESSAIFDAQAPQRTTFM